MGRVSWVAAIVTAAALTALAGCTFDPAPEPALALPAEGVYRSGEPLWLDFSEPVRAECLRVRIWPAALDVEGELPDDLAPVMDTCRATETECDGGAVLTLEDDGTTATIELPPEGLGQPDVPRILEVLPGLCDLAGHRTGAPYYFDFQFLPPKGEGPGENPDIPLLLPATYVLVASIDDPLPAVLTYISDVRVLENGRFALAGAEGDEIGDAPKNTTNPEELFVDDTDSAYTVYAVGDVWREGGERFLSSEPFDIAIYEGPLLVEISNVRLHAKVVRQGEHDHLDGTLAFEAATLVIGDNRHEYPGGSTTLVGVYAPEGTCEAGMPKICGDLCGAAVLGQCFPPEDFPPPEFCEPQ